MVIKPSHLHWRGAVTREVSRVSSAVPTRRISMETSMIVMTFKVVFIYSNLDATD